MRLWVTREILDTRKEVEVSFEFLHAGDSVGTINRLFA